MSIIHLVSCVSRKRTAASPAKDLYLSPWFQKARAYMEARGGPWYILSAEHGLLPPDRVIAPYDRSLNTMGVEARRAWAFRVQEQLAAEDLRAERIVVLAGERYRHLLRARLEELATVEVPMEGLGIGKQLAWLRDHR